MKTRKFVTTFFSLMVTALLSAQTQPRPAVFRIIETPDSVTNAQVILHQDSRIEQLVVSKKTVESAPAVSTKQSSSTTTSGYRVQIFSSNVQRTAKSEAFRLEKEVRNQFPDQNVYVRYTSPFWKVRIGDFRTMKV